MTPSTPSSSVVTVYVTALFEELMGHRFSSFTGRHCNQDRWSICHDVSF